MPSTEPYSSPFILDLDMSDNIEDPDFEFFESDTPHIAAASPAAFFVHGGGGIKGPDFNSPSNSQNPVPGASGAFLHSSPQAPSYKSADSPDDSYRDSSSDSSGFKRKSSSESSRSAITGIDVSMSDVDGGDWKMSMGNSPDCPQDSYQAAQASMMSSASTPIYAFNDKAMENDFDFESAASSPKYFTPTATMKSPDMPTLKYDTPNRRTPGLRAKVNHRTKASQNSITKSMHGLTTNVSRENSPLSANMISQQSSPSAFFNASPTPANGVEFINGPMLNQPVQNMNWPVTYDFGMQNTAGIDPPFMPPPPQNQIPPAMPFSGDLSHLNNMNMFKPILTLHPTPLKSRVETQIPIKMTIFPLPPGITKLHLPTHTISKPKLLAKPSPQKAPDTLELTTTLVCTSAMQSPQFRRRAFDRAAGILPPPETKEKPKSEEDGEAASDENDENKPLNGGEVKICSGCITRERKRAARKKVKKVDEEESWHKDEDKRVIVFNTQEIKDWQQPSSQPQSDAVGDRREPMVPEGAMQVDAPMRIACYCRHQNEKLGFQVIFTIRDWKGQLVAQEITSSIMITDDHKTHTVPQMPGQMAYGMDGQPFLQHPAYFDPNMAYGMQMQPFRHPQSAADLQNMQRNFALQYQNPPSLVPQQSQGNSNGGASRSLSRQASPSEGLNPNKKRKASGSAKVPSGLTMTRMEAPQPYPGALGAPANGAGMPGFNAPGAVFPQAQNGAFGHPQQAAAQPPPQFNNGPPTPNSNDQVFFANGNRTQSMDNLAVQQMYSAPPSAIPSRAPSPNSMRNNAQAFQQAQMAQAVGNGIYGMPLALNPQTPPTIHKMIPNEGPKAGGIEVTCLGSGFCQGLEVMFGEVKATTTTFWGETSLVCLLPPATAAGTVPVTFKHQHQQHQQQLQPYASAVVPKQQAFFKYVDDDEQQIIRTALSVLGHKMTGRMEDVRDLARRIVGDGPSSWTGGSSQGQQGSGAQPPVNGFSAAAFGVETEATLLRILDLIDLDDSSRSPRFNTKCKSGQTMLHLACSLGLHRFVAALLARGANPEPRDLGGYTPMHFAAMHDHPLIVKRLMLCGADPSWRTLQGYTAADLCTSEETLRATRRAEHHIRRRSAGSALSKSSSAVSLYSNPEPPIAAMAGMTLSPALEDSETTSDFVDSDDTDDAEEGVYMQTRRRSVAPAVADDALLNNGVVAPEAGAAAGGLVSPAAAMAAFRDSITAQMQQLQHSMAHLNLLQMPNLPNLPNYQAYLPTTAPMVRRISNLVPHIGSPKAANATVTPASPASPATPPPAKEADSKWWDLFSSSSPPAYEDIYPHPTDDTLDSKDVKVSSAQQAAAEAMVDNACAEAFDHPVEEAAGPSSPVAPKLLSLEELTEEEQVQLTLANTTKVRFRSDRKLFFIWIPILVVLMGAMLYTRIPELWANATQLATTFSEWRASRVVEVL